MMLPPVAGLLSGRGYRPVPISHFCPPALMGARRRAVLSIYIADFCASEAFAAPLLSWPGLKKYPPSMPAFHQVRMAFDSGLSQSTLVALLSRPLPLSAYGEPDVAIICS